MFLAKKLDINKCASRKVGINKNKYKINSDHTTLIIQVGSNLSRFS